MKVGNRWQIPQSEADRVLESQPNAGSHNVMDASPNVNLTVIEGADPAWQQDIDALQVENQALHRKLEVSEIQQESLSKEVETVRETLGAVRQEGERTRGDYEHTRDQLDSALRSVGSLTEEIKGLTVALHRGATVNRCVNSSGGFLPVLLVALSDAVDVSDPVGDLRK